MGLQIICLSCNITHLLLPLIVFKYDITGLNNPHVDKPKVTVLNLLIQSFDTKLLCKEKRQHELAIKQYGFFFFLKANTSWDAFSVCSLCHGKTAIFNTLHGWSTLAHTPMPDGGTWDPAATVLVDEEVGRLGPWYLWREELPNVMLKILIHWLIQWVLYTGLGFFYHGGGGPNAGNTCSRQEFILDGICPLKVTMAIHTFT